MKKYVLLALLALPSFATEVMPFGHSMCLNSTASACKDGKKLYYTNVGCACLYTHEFYSASICERALIRCDAGKSFSNVFLFDANSQQQKYKGCGCFTVFDGMIPLSMEG